MEVTIRISKVGTISGIYNKGTTFKEIKDDVISKHLPKAIKIRFLYNNKILRDDETLEQIEYISSKDILAYPTFASNGSSQTENNDNKLHKISEQRKIKKPICKNPNQELKLNPTIEHVREIVDSDPQNLDAIIKHIDSSDPIFAKKIRENPDIFLTLIGSEKSKC